jgi:hypothetical protein
MHFGSCAFNPGCSTFAFRAVVNHYVQPADRGGLGKTQASLPHADNGLLFMKFVQSKQVKDIFRSGFVESVVQFVWDNVFPHEAHFVTTNGMGCFIWKLMPIAAMKGQTMK